MPIEAADGGRNASGPGKTRYGFIQPRVYLPLLYNGNKEKDPLLRVKRLGPFGPIPTHVLRHGERAGIGETLSHIMKRGSHLSMVPMPVRLHIFATLKCPVGLVF